MLSNHKVVSKFHVTSSNHLGVAAFQRLFLLPVRCSLQLAVYSNEATWKSRGNKGMKSRRMEAPGPFIVTVCCSYKPDHSLQDLCVVTSTGILCGLF